MMGTTIKRKVVMLALAGSCTAFIAGVAFGRSVQHTDWMGLLTFGREIHRGDPGMVLQDVQIETVYDRNIIIGLREDHCLVWKWAEVDSSISW